MAASLHVLLLFAVAGPAHSDGRSSSPPEPVTYAAEVPLRGVDIRGNILLEPIMQANIDYLLSSFDVDHLLYWFRLRAGQSAPPGSRPQVGFWDTDLKGSNAGRFLMGAGNALRWIDNSALRDMMNQVVDGVEVCRNISNGYILAFSPEGFMHSEQGDYGRSWFTQGLIEAGKSGNPKVWPLLRGQYDWFNDPDQNPYLPYLYDGISNGEQGQIASTRMYLETPVGIFADSQVAQDTYRDNTWMHQLIMRNASGISSYHMPAPNRPHCYEITTFLSMFDNYRATGNLTWLEAAKGAWDLIRENFLHIDGSSSLTEGTPYTDPVTGEQTNWQAKTYRIAPGTETGETCCTSFWIKFNQRFHLLSPDEERYAAQVETAIYNALLRQMGFRPAWLDAWHMLHQSATHIQTEEFQDGTQRPPFDSVGPHGALPPGIRDFAVMEGTVAKAQNINTCCEGQGTRIFGSLPEYIYSISNTMGGAGMPDGFYVNLFASSTLELNATVISGHGSQPSAPKPPRRAPFDAVPQPPPPLSWRQLATDGWHGGQYCGGKRKAPCPVNIKTIEQCKARCLASAHPNMCMGLTWVPAESRCTLYQSMDLTTKSTTYPGCEQWLVVGRRNEVQHDYIVGATSHEHKSSISAAPEFGGMGATPIRFTMNTNFPFSHDVAMRMSWKDHNVSSVSVRLKIRMPSWLSEPLSILINGQESARGLPGTYIGFDRHWVQNDVISFTLPIVYRLSLYTGVDQVKGYEGKRYALLVGPIVLACVGPMDTGEKNSTVVLPMGPTDPSEWLITNVSHPLHFNIKGSNRFEFKPMWDVLDGERFTTYPIFGGAPESDQLLV